METIKVLDHGFVTLVDHMGNDKRIVDAARISYANYTESLTNADISLLRYLMRNRHWSPFEMVEFVFRMKMPIFVARQFVRHRTANINEMSGRYVKLPDEFYVPNADRMNLQSKDNKQGSSSDVIDDVERYQKMIYEQCKASHEVYDTLDKAGLAKELSRMVLPVNTYTEWYFKMDLRNLFNFLSLRLDGHTQGESRLYADAVRALIEPIVPHSVAAFDDYILNSMQLSSTEVKLLNAFLSLASNGKCVYRRGELFDKAGVKLKGREWDEFLGKLERLGVLISTPIEE